VSLAREAAGTGLVKPMYTTMAYKTNPVVTGKSLELNASDFNTVIGRSAANLLNAWKDRPLSNNNAAQGTGAAQPTYTVNQINGRPAVVTSGQSDFMTILDNANLDMDSGSGFTIFLAVNATGYVAHGSGLNYFIAKGNGDVASNMYGINTQSSNKFDGQTGNNEVQGAGTGAAINGAAHIATLVMDNAATDGFLYRDGVLVSTNSSATVGSDSTSNLTIGGGTGVATRYSNGKYGHIIIYNRVLSAVEMHLVHRYLSTLWGVSV
jgi:hypothetical protein